MWIFRDLIIRKGFEELISHAEFIKQQTTQCLQPSFDVYYHYYYSSLGENRNPLEISEREISMSLSAMEGYISQLVNLRKELSQSYNENKRLLTKFCDRYHNFCNCFNEINKIICSLIFNVKSLRDYKLCRELVTMLSCLESIKQRIAPDVGYCNTSTNNNIETII